MTGETSQNSRRIDLTNSVEQIRIIVTIFLVLYHVIGAPGAGLRVPDSSNLRFFADVMADFRMPTFAFIAGFIYALRPVTTAGIGGFFVGKLQRLAVPGLIAAMAFATFSTVLHLSGALALSDFWRPLVYPYMHFWFLQSILILFFVIGPLDALTRNRAELVFLPPALALYLLPLPIPHIFSLNGAVNLAPFFIIGICIYRRRDLLVRHARPISILALALVAIWVAWTAIDYARTGGLVPENREVKALILAIPLCTILLLNLPYARHARALGQFSFTIYLYHVFGTAAIRIALYKLGITALPVHLVLGVVVGVVLPTLLHLCVMRQALAAQLILGIKRKKPRPTPIIDPALT